MGETSTSEPRSDRVPSQERTWKEQAEALIDKWRAEEADYKQNAANHAPLGGSLYVSNQSKWALSQRHADELSALLASPCQQGQGAEIERACQWVAGEKHEIGESCGPFCQRFVEHASLVSEIDKLMKSRRFHNDSYMLGVLGDCRAAITGEKR